MCRWEVAQGIGETWRKGCAKKEARAEGVRPATGGWKRRNWLSADQGTTVEVS